MRYPTVTAFGSRLLKIIIENFAGHGLQKSGGHFETKNFSVGAVRLRTFMSRIKYSTVPDGNMLGLAVVRMDLYTKASVVRVANVNRNDGKWNCNVNAPDNWNAGNEVLSRNR